MVPVVSLMKSCALEFFVLCIFLLKWFHGRLTVACIFLCGLEKKSTEFVGFLDNGIVSCPGSM